MQNSISSKVATVCDTEHKGVTCSFYLFPQTQRDPNKNQGTPGVISGSCLGRRFKQCWQKTQKKKSGYTRSIFWYTSWPTVLPMPAENPNKNQGTSGVFSGSCLGRRFNQCRQKTQKKNRGTPGELSGSCLGRRFNQCWQKIQTKIRVHPEYFLVHVLADGSTNAGRKPKQKAGYTRSIFWFISWPTVQPMLAENPNKNQGTPGVYSGSCLGRRFNHLLAENPNKNRGTPAVFSGSCLGRRFNQLLAENPNKNQGTPAVFSGSCLGRRFNQWWQKNPPKKSGHTRSIFWFMSWPTVQPMLAESTPLLAKQIACSPAEVLHRRRQRDTITTTTSTLTLTIIAAKTTPLPTIKAASHRSKLKPLTVKRKQFKSPT